MKKRLCALLLALSLPLGGCTAMLEREYDLVQTHTQSLTAAEDPSALQASNYQELVAAVFYLVTQHADAGLVRLYNYAGDVEADLTAACLEVVQKDPLGAFAVDYIKHEVNRIVSYYEAAVDITYRRSAEEVAAIQSVTGSSAIKRELRDALTAFSPRTVLRVSYLAEDEEYLLSLIRQAYYAAPSAALGLPQVALSLYPEQGIQRIVEIDLTYSAELDVLLAQCAELEEAADQLLAGQSALNARRIWERLLNHVVLVQDPSLNTAYAALIQGQANGEGLALAYKLLCDRAGLYCTVVQGWRTQPPAQPEAQQDQTPLQDSPVSQPSPTPEAAPSLQPEAQQEPQEAPASLEPRFWNIVAVPNGGYRHVDCAEELFGFTDLQLAELGTYLWDNSYPLCRETAPGS